MTTTVSKAKNENIVLSWMLQVTKGWDPTPCGGTRTEGVAGNHDSRTGADTIRLDNNHNDSYAEDNEQHKRQRNTNNDQRNDTQNEVSIFDKIKETNSNLTKGIKKRHVNHKRLDLPDVWDKWPEEAHSTSASTTTTDYYQHDGAPNHTRPPDEEQAE